MPEIYDIERLSFVPVEGLSIKELFKAGNQTTNDDDQGADREAD